MSIDNEFDAFAEGVEPGGLRNRTQIKILITFIVSRIREPLKDTMIIEALQIHGLANYFEVSQALDELFDNGILSTADGLVYITPKGSLSVDELSQEFRDQRGKSVGKIIRWTDRRCFVQNSA